MKKIMVLALFLLILLSPAVFASQAFEEVLSDKIKSDGIFDGNNGIIYADKLEFENTSLLIVSADGSELKCEVYGDTDGLQLTDTVTFSCEGYRLCRLIVVKSGGKNYIMFSRMNENEFYTIRDDAFTQTTLTDYFPVKTIAASENGKIVSYSGEGSVNSFLNRLKEESIREYPFVNKINSLSGEEAAKIKTTLSACADVMSFDIKNYDYDTLFKYVLYTHENFKVLTDIDPNSGKSSSLGYNNVSLVGSEFIDYVMEKVFRVTPEKPPVNTLVSRGFCYNDGYYLYTGGFDIYFATEVRDLIGAYDLGGNVVFVIFTDIYREENSETPEYSFAILQKTADGYSLLRLGMGESLPSAAELRAYSPFSTYGGSVWNTRTRGDTKNGDTKRNSGLLLPLLLIICSVGIVGLVCSIVVLVRTRR